MKHSFILYDMVDLNQQAKNTFVSDLRETFSKFGYQMSDEQSEIALCWREERFLFTDFLSKSAIIISNDSICHDEAQFQNGNGIWKIPERIDAIIIYGDKIYFTPQTIRCPLFKWNKLNYIQLTAALIHSNSEN